MDTRNKFQNKQIVEGDMVEFEWDRASICVEDASHQPQPCCGHSFTIVDSYAYVFGGMIGFARFDQVSLQDEDLEPYPSNALYRLDFRAAPMRWSKLNLSSSIEGSSRITERFQSRPLPRWKHSATALDRDRILVFGGFHSTSLRLNDVWIYEISADTWSQPNPQHNMEASVKNQLSFNAWPNAPSPRAGHSATLIGDQLIVFGGYGGLGYSRRDLDDLYSLNIKSLEWMKILAKGNPPEKRSGHQAAAVGKKIFIIGGASTSTQYQDVYILDLENEPVWSKLSILFPQPLWNHTVAVTAAVPNYKIFSFGGNMGALTEQNRLGIPTNILGVMDAGTTEWTGIACGGNEPEARCDASMVYDPQSSKLILFGGWSNFWFNDIHVLNVGLVVGPPYAVTSLNPSCGPVTGGTDIVITGIDFEEADNIVVRFGNSDNHGSFIDVPGKFLSSSSISCVSPRFGPVLNFPGTANKAVAVRVSINRLAFTNSKHVFSIFSVTCAQSCIAFGTGLLSGNVVGKEMSFNIQAKDFQGNDRYTGGDEFIVEIVSMNGEVHEQEERIRGHVEDLGIGQYLVTYVVSRSGRYAVWIEFLGTFGGSSGFLRGSGVELTFVDASSGFTKSEVASASMLGDTAIQNLTNDVNLLASTANELSKALFVKLTDDSWSAEDHIRVLISVKEAIVLLDKVKEDIQLILDRSECYIKYFRQHEAPLLSLEAEIETAKKSWERVKAEAPHLLSRLTSIMKTYVSKIKCDVKIYESHVKFYLEDLKKSDFFLFETGPANALDSLDAAELLHNQQKAVCAKMTNVAYIFEVSDDIESANQVIDEITTVLHDYRFLWETYVRVLALIEETNNMPWTSLDPNIVDETSKTLLSLIRKLPKTVKSSDAYNGLEKIVKEFVATCPLIMRLRSPCMRPRHWNELMNIVQSPYDIFFAKSNIRLADLLKLRLHEKVVEVEEITEKAMKEAKHEEILSSLEGTWSTAMFVMAFYKDTTIPLIRLDDDIVDLLESDQTAVQSVLGSRFSHFKKKASEWQQCLTVISEVTQMLTEIQHAWTYLEPLFINSEEVKRELPEDTKRFHLINERMIAILHHAWTVKIIKEVCLQRRFLELISDLQKQQDACKKSLGEYLDGKRMKFPRFFFISEEDLLDILSNSAQPVKVLRHVSFQFIIALISSVWFPRYSLD